MFGWGKGWEKAGKRLGKGGEKAGKRRGRGGEEAGKRRGKGGEKAGDKRELGGIGRNRALNRRIDMRLPGKSRRKAEYLRVVLGNTEHLCVKLGE